jgi:pyridinium-3,5-bisthiocarboxylic acid mononucleotide nickel chelatase
VVACHPVVSPAPEPESPGASPFPAVRPRSRLHLDPVGGMAGDMFLAACLDLGVPLSVVTSAVEALGLDEVTVEAWPSSRGGRAGTRFRVRVDGESLEEDDPDRLVTSADWDLIGLLGFLRASALVEPVRIRAARMFRRLAIAWARSAGVPITAVRFSGGPGLDFLVDLVGAAAVVEHLFGAGEGDDDGPWVSCGPVFLGGPGSDGRPVPPPIVSRLLEGVTPPPDAGWWRTRDGAGQCLTPTGATLLVELVDEWLEEPGLSDGGPAEGWGLGARELPDRPNALRVVLVA